MAKKRTMNEYRQTKEYKLDPVQQVLAKQIEEYEEYAKKANNSEKMKENRETMKECPLDSIEEAKILIVEKIVKHLDDVLFEKVCNEMGNHYVFQSQNYLTEAGYEQFEDEWFEFYHEHHGDILASIHNKLIY